MRITSGRWRAPYLAMNTNATDSISTHAPLKSRKARDTPQCNVQMGVGQFLGTYLTPSRFNKAAKTLVHVYPGTLFVPGYPGTQKEYSGQAPMSRSTTFLWLSLELFTNLGPPSPTRCRYPDTTASTSSSSRTNQDTAATRMMIAMKAYNQKKPYKEYPCTSAKTFVDCDKTKTQTQSFSPCNRTTSNTHHATRFSNHDTAMKLSLPVIALVLALCTSSHAQPLLDLTATLGVAASVTANTEATITYGVAPAATTLVITADADSDVTLTAVSTVSADLPQGHSSLAVSAGAGYTLAVSGGSAVSAKLTTPPLSVAAQALVTSDGQVGCF
eukprot:2372340-Rhodomonas_salina.1